MSTTIDQKVVEMRFDNKHFESNVSTTMSTLDKLKQKLNLDGASKGLENVSTAAKKVDMNGLGTAVETVRTRFSALEVMGVTALANITNSAVNAGKRMVSALTIEPIKDGFSEYEMTLNAIQTTMAATGKTSKEVEEELKKLDEYADKTVYSTADMLNNLPKFTNAGVELEKATGAMIGIANATALAGGDAGKASIAFYNLGQAIGTGYLTRMDYNSINNAGIATMEWKNQMVEAAIAQGTLTKVGEDAYEAGGKTYSLQQLFIDGLQKQWATTDVMMKVFGDYGDETTEIGKKSYAAAQDIKTFSMMMDSLKATAGTGWKDTWQIIFGDLEGAKIFWTNLTNGISDFITKMADWRNKLLGDSLGSKWDKFSEKITNAGGSMDDFQAKLGEVTKEHDISLDDLIAEYGSLERAVSSGAITTDMVTKAIGKMTDAEEEYAEAQKKSNTYTVVKGDNLTKIAKKYGMTWRELYALNQDIIKDPNLIYPEQILKLSDAQLESIGYTKEQIGALRELATEADKAGTPMNELIDTITRPTGREMLLTSFTNIFYSLLDSLKAVGAAWNEVFNPEPVEGETTTLYKIIKAIYEFTEAIKLNEKDAENLKRTFKGLFALLDIVLTIVGGPLKFAFKAITSILGMFGFNVLDVTACVGDVLVKFRDWIDACYDFPKILAKIGPFLVSTYKSIKEWIKGLDLLEKYPFLQNILDRIKAFASQLNILDKIPFLRSAINGIKEWIETLKQSDNIPRDIIAGLAKGLKEGIPKVLSAVVEVAKSLFERFCSFFDINSPSKVFITLGGFIISGLILGLLKGIPGIGDAINNIGTFITDFFKDFDFGTAISGIVSVGLTTGFVKIASGISALASPLEGLGELFEGTGAVMKKSAKPIAKTIKSFSKVMNSFAFSIKAKALKDVAIAIAILAGSIIALTLVTTEDNIGKMWNAVLIIGALAAIMGLLAFAVDKFTKSSASISKNGASFSGFNTGLLAIGAAILLLGLTVKLIGKMDPDEAKQGFLGLLGLVVAIGLVVAAYGFLVQGYGATNIDKAGVMLTKMAGAMLVMLIVAKLAAGMEDDEMIRAGIAILAFSGIIVGLIAATKLAGNDADKVGGTILKIAGAMLLMVLVAKIASGMNSSEMDKASKAIAGFALIIVGLIWATKLAGRKVEQVGKTILSIAGAMLLLVVVAKIIAAMDPVAMIKGAAGLFGLVGVIALILMTVKAFGKNASKMAGTLMAVAGAIAILAAVAIILGFVNEDHLKKGITAIGLLAAIIAGVVFVAKGANDAKGTMIGIAVVIGIMAAAIIALSFIDPEKLIAPTLAMVALMGMFALILKCGSNVQSNIWALIAIDAAIILLAAALYLLAGLPVESTLGAAAGLSMLMLSLSVVLVLLSKMMGNALDALTGIGLLTLMAVPLLAFVGVLALMDGVDNALENAKALTLLASVMSLLLLPLTLAGALASMALAGVIMLTAMAVPLLAFVGILALMQCIEDAEKNVSLLVTLMTTMTAMLVVLAIVGPLAMAGVTAMAALTALVVAIGALVVGIGALMKAFPQLQSFLDTGIPVLEQLAHAIGSVIGNLISGVIDSMEESLPRLGSCLSNFMIKAMPFILGARLLNGNMMAGVKALAETILILTAADILDGLGRIFGGESALSDFGDQLPKLGEDIAAFAESLGTFGEEKVASVRGAADAIKALAGAAEVLPNEGGWIAAILGENSLASFGDQLPSLGTNLASFVTNLGTFTDEQASTVSCACDAIKAFAAAAKEIPNEGGWAAAILGENSLAAFGDQLPSLGTNLASFVTNLGTFGEDQINTVSCACDAIKAFATASKSIDGQAEWAKKIFGDNSLSGFSEEFGSLGTGLKNFKNNLGTFTEGNVTAVTNAVKALTAITNLAKVDLKSAKSNLSGFGDTLPPLAEDITSFCNSMPGSGLVTACINSVDKIIAMVKNAVAISASAMDSFTNALKRLGSDGVKAFVNEITSNTSMDKANTAGEKLATEFSKGISNKKSDVEDEGEKVAEKAIDGLDSLYDDAKEKGQDLGDGLKAGINSKKTEVYWAAYALGQKAVQGEKDGQKSNSPSKLTRLAGQWIGEGLILGMGDMSRSVYNAGHDLGESATGTISSTISSIASLINSDIDAQPTIRPVLDLSDVRSNASAIGGLLGGDTSIGVLANVSSISSMMNRRNQNGVNTEVVSAINKLRKDMGNLDRATYNINGVSYAEGSDVSDAIKTIVRAARVERRT